MMWNEILKKIDKKHTPIIAAQRWGQKIKDIQLINEGINLAYHIMPNHHLNPLCGTHFAINTGVKFTISQINTRVLTQKPRFAIRFF